MKIKEKEIKYHFNAVKLLRNSKLGILSTISKKYKDYPFGSLATYVTCRDRSVYFYFSDIAQHTINFKNNKKVCFTIIGNKKNSDLQNNERLSLIGNIYKIDNGEIEYCKDVFHNIFPESKGYEKFHGFNFYRLEINNIRWIGGFGKIAWLESEQWKKNVPEWTGKENSIIEHMNNDHSNSIISSVHAQHKIKDKKSKMIFITIDGYYVKCSKGIYFIQLEKICNNVKEYRKELVKLAKKYRTFEIK